MNNYDAHKESIKGKTLTAYELADAMDKKGFRYREVKAAVKMLRQQADRIAELEKQSKLQSDNKVNAEPVAWMQTWENQDGELKHTVNIEQIGKQDIPLYTTPQIKELSDEKLVEIAKRHGVVGLHEDAGLHEFVKEILNHG